MPTGGESADQSLICASAIEGEIRLWVFQTSRKVDSNTVEE